MYFKSRLNYILIVYSIKFICNLIVGITEESKPVDLEFTRGDHILGVLDTSHSKLAESINPYTCGGNLFTKLLYLYMSQYFVLDLDTQTAQKVNQST